MSKIGVRWIQPGATGVDFSFAHPPPAVLVELGYEFAVGYLGPNPKSAKLLLNPLDYINAGLGVLYVYEASATSPNNGAALGAQHGADAKRQLEALGQPYSVPFLMAFDTNTTASNIANHVAYYNAAAAAAAPYFIGGYMDTDLAAAVDEAIGWLPLAWSWSGGSKADAEAKARALGYHVLQLKGFYIDNTWAVDPNVAIRPFTTWGFENTIPDEPIIKEDEDMKPLFLTITEAPGGIYLYVPGCSPIPFAGVTDFQALAAGFGKSTDDIVKVSQAQFDRLVEAGKVAVTVPPITVPAPVVTIPPFTFPTFTVTPQG